MRRCDQRAADFLGKFRRAAFVRVYAHDPIVLEQRQRVVAEFAETLEFDVHMAHAELRADRRRVVGAERVRHHHFVGPQNRRQHGAQVVGVVERDDVKADGLGHVGKISAGGILIQMLCAATQEKP